MRETSQNTRITDVLRMVSPGTQLRAGLENVLRAKTGALIVIGDTDLIKSISHGGFAINAEFNPYKIYELAKMDGAVILSNKADRIVSANVELNPDPGIMTQETGIRHRNAERVSKQTGQVVISISQRRSIITIYKEDIKYILQETNRLLTKANQAIQTLEKYRQTLNQELINLSALEIEDAVTVHDVAQVMKRSEMVLRVADEIERYILELGHEGRLIEMQLDELVSDVANDLKNVISDYLVDFDKKTLDDSLIMLATMSDDELLSTTRMAKLLGYEIEVEMLDMQVYPRGFRLLSKIPRLPSAVIRNILAHFDDLQGVINASMDELEEVEGIGEVRAQNIVSGLRRIAERVYNNQPLVTT
ncbi:MULTISPECIES: DNA integrity scanning diadenylate cyclase DisA [unclassified Fusibacter]|uniref:DNA integrity scanning diadenylate cyclase DisA n=1 Tax=unclassified Fusibacter TaxID=2624464 RepID=UPI00101369C5|nr:MULTISPECIES: DNA integrity scanning diadenylate cyclase DisA [unclassified Fusibacter]MCK8061354.1 DNA integrity scanning diadenylate cyclase DisA [Fusibacter sp. A2]NPE23603.1 DNA integrity scanning protein DisA [Fusibacter sp. A1]RXV59011.1 DNA integrity scanning protein DisA [Fusibacter sp. A1]